MDYKALLTQVENTLEAIGTPGDDVYTGDFAIEVNIKQLKKPA